MSFFKKLFNSPKDKETKEQNLDLESLPLDQIFVRNFIKNNGKFLYCTTLEEVTENLAKIIQENSWDTLICNDSDLFKLTKTLTLKTKDTFDNALPFFTSCEHLIAENGSILFSSNQLKECKISELSDNFIVYATTSQFVKTNGDSLTGIKTRYLGNIPSNISAIKNYNPNSKEIDFMNYGNTNAKNLYLLLFEDL
ncbi:LUD domain-containing protein [uncultured Lutibacter sp.]|uniref:LUD domain-containing protein n=1 Tax=uncultured Lutibacter sp. TaxID=437739 RepID=UPI002603AE5F|nr:LUD domain-containing protein [uncultured Lutibacter sp.]